MEAVSEHNRTILAKGRGRCLGRNRVGFGAGLKPFGKWLTKTERSWAPLGENSEDVGGHLDGLDINPLPPEQLFEPEPVRTLPPRPGKDGPPKRVPRCSRYVPELVKQRTAGPALPKSPAPPRSGVCLAASREIALFVHGNEKIGECSQDHGP